MYGDQFGQFVSGYLGLKGLIVVLHFGKIETCNVCVCFHRQRPFYDKEKSNPN